MLPQYARYSPALLLLAVLGCAAVAPPQVALTPEEQEWLAAHPKVRLMATPDYQPADFIDENGQHQGIAADLLKLISERTGLQFDIVNLPLEKRLLPTPEERGVDGVTLSADSPQRAEHWLVTDPCLEFPAYIITRQSVDRYLTPADLENSRVAVVTGYAVEEYLQTNYPKIHLAPVPDTRTGLEKVSFGLVDALVSDVPVSTYWLEQEGFTNLKVSGESGYVYKLGISSRKDWPHLHTVLQKGLASISTEEREAIRRKWLKLPYESFFRSRQFWLPVLWGGGGLFILFVAAMVGNAVLVRTVRRRTKSLNDQLRFEEVLARLSADLIAASSAGCQRMIGDAVRAIGQFLQADRVGILELSPDSTRLAARHEYHAENITPLLFPAGQTPWQSESRDAADQWLWQRVLRGETTIVHQLTDLPAEAAAGRLFVEKQQLRSLLLVGLKVGERVMGMLFVAEVKRERRWLPELVAQVELLGRIVAGTLARIQAEQTIDKLAAFPRYNPNPVLEIGGTGALTYANEAAESMAHSLGLAAVSDLLPPNGAEVVRDCLATKQTRTDLEATLGERTLNWWCFPIAALGVVHCYVTDVTERHRFQLQLRETQKLESIGLLAGGIAHDFNNLIQVLQSLMDLASMANISEEERLQCLRDQALILQRAALLTRQLLAFARRQPLVKTSLAMNGVIADLLPLLRSALGKTIILEFQPGVPLSFTFGDRNQIEQVLLNLCVNARDAMPTGGTIAISLQEAHFDEAFAAQHPWSRAGAFVRLQVRDTGSGMDAPTLRRAFEPFFTTKPPGKGTGLGLSVVYGIVQSHEGCLRVESQLNHGTTFSVYLPLAQPEPSLPTGASNAASRKLTVLVADDEASIRLFLERLLTDAGYRVLCEENGLQAVRRFRQSVAAVDLVILDIRMPLLSGREAALQIRKLAPTIPILFISGNAWQEPPTPGTEDIPVLEKPFQAEHLFEQLRLLVGTQG